MLISRLLSGLAFCLFLSAVNAQRPAFPYEKTWKKIDTLITKKGLPGSALAEVNKIFNAAKQEKNQPQLIRALLYKMGIRELREEDALQKNIRESESLIPALTVPARNILQSITAGYYWQFFQTQRWKIYNRSETIRYKKEDIDTWSASDYHNKISELYLASLSAEKTLQETRLEPFDAIILKGNMRHLRPTLFDLLAHRALEYLRNDERDLVKPSWAFEISQPSFFAPADSFAMKKFRHRDSTALQFLALGLFQKLLAFHQKDPLPDALLDADIARIAFVEQYGVMENKIELYRDALKKIGEKYGDLPAASQAWYLLAQSWADEASLYNPAEGNAHRDAYIKAHEICSRVIAQKDSSEGKINCLNLVREIENKSLEFQAEKVNLPGVPFRMLVSYRNISRIGYRIIALDDQKKSIIGDEIYSDDYWKKLLRFPSIRTAEQLLPETKDYQLHRAEIKIDTLPPGEYLLLAASDPGFGSENKLLAAQLFYVSNIAWVRSENEFFVLNRETGQPLPRASVQVWYRYYDYAKRKNLERKGENILTDKNGYFSLEPSKSNTDYNLKLEIRYQQDRLFLDDYTYLNFPRSRGEIPERNISTTFLFTDRSIYRPGQTVYLKGIVVTRNPATMDTRIEAGRRSNVYLYDANGQKQDSVSVTSNEFGSYSARFTLPSGLLNGQFRIEDNSTRNSQWFSVEEYKRPRFRVEIEKPAGTYRLNDSIRVTGLALAYAGNAIGGAQVKFRVVRRTVFPYWYGFVRSGRPWPPAGGNEMEIAHGETLSDKEGRFSMIFPAIPDASVPKTSQPVFYYDILADVTDINGETRSGQSQLAVSYQALLLNFDMPASASADSFRSFSLRSTNLGGDWENAGVRITISKLKAPGRIFRQRYWEQPDQFLYEEETYHRFFPWDVYKDEDEVSRWPLELTLETIQDSSRKDIPFLLTRSPLMPGWYVLEASAQDKYGEPVKAVHYLELTGPANTSPSAYGKLVSGAGAKEPGDTATYEIQSNLDSLWILHHISRNADKPERKYLSLPKGNLSFTIPVAEADRGGIALHIIFLKHNRVYTNQRQIVVPFSNKQLSITSQTWRDKTQPGSEETWKLRVSGYKSEKVAAEILTAMYDASLDQFRPHQWSIPPLWFKNIRPVFWSGDGGFAAGNSMGKEEEQSVLREVQKIYDQLLSGRSGMPFWWLYPYQFGYNKGVKSAIAAVVPDGEKLEEAVVTGRVKELKQNAPAVAADTASANDEQKPEAPRETPSAVQPRKNFNETAFFFPDLQTDSSGAVEFSFRMPEAVTRWKWMSLAHTRELAMGYLEKTIVTRKDLMVQPNPPRFLREGDRMDFSVKIVNLTDSELTGQVELQLVDPENNQPVDGWFRNFFPNQYFTVAPKESVPASFSIEIPYQYNRPVIYRVIARSGNFSDGEEAALPVVSNRMLVTESLPLNLRGEGKKSFRFEKLLKSGESETLSQHALTVEFTTNPAWYAIQSLPYLMEFPYECTEQIFNRYYANSLAAMISRSVPRLQPVFEKWKNLQPVALQSALEKNEELKSVLLQETPWVLDAKDEATRKRNIALLFDMLRMSHEQAAALDKLASLQTANGGFVWFAGGPDDRYITQYILSGIGHLKKLKALPDNNEKLNRIISNALQYLDARLQEDYVRLIRSKADLNKNQLGSLQVQYLYMRSFFSDHPVSGTTFTSYNYFRKQSQQFWLPQRKYMQGMIALSLFRTGDIQTAKNILQSLRQNAIVDAEMGMYWKEFNTGGYYWYNAPIEAHALLTEAFSDILNDNRITDDLKTWLLKNKQTNNWRSTRATADACYALLLQGSDWLRAEPSVFIELGQATAGGLVISGDEAESGTGYFKKVIEGSGVKPSLGEITVNLKTAPGTTFSGTAWGAVYWQYFEDLDKITPAATPLRINKKLFIERSGDRGPVLEPLEEGVELKVGDKVKVRIEIRSDRNLEYVHLKDMRASCLEPVQVLSGYQWQGGLGYYESTKDASTHFFFGYLPRGTWVFEYSLFATHTGTFSNGISSIQCMYAPEFAAHSEGIRFPVEK